MTKLPGLTRHDDRPSVGGANRGRVQVRNPIGDVAIRPQARPVDTYSRPMAPPQGPNGLQQLAGALAQISPALTNYIETTGAKAQKDAEDRAMRRIGGMSFQEARAAVDGGKMAEMDNPWFKAAFMKQYGERLAYERVNELTREYETNFDKTQGSFDEFVRQRMAEDLEAHGGDPHFSNAYNQIMNNYGAKANQVQAQYQTEQVKQDTIGGVYDTFLGTARTMQQEGKSPEEIVSALRARYEGNRQLLHVDFREQDKEMVRLAEAFANEGNVAMAKAILNGDRMGADGTKLGALSANREFQADAQRILMAADRKLEENNGNAAFNSRMTFNDQARAGNLDQEALLGHHKANPGAFTDAQVLSLINQNDAFKTQQAEQAAKHEQRMALEAQSRASEANLLQRNMDLAGKGQLPYVEEGTVLTSGGETKKVSVNDQLKAVASEINRGLEWRVENGKMSPDDMFTAQVEAFTANNLENPKWSQVLSAGRIASTPFTNSGGELPSQLREGAELYLRLHAANPALLDTHIKGSGNRDFYEAFRIATQYGRLGVEQALQTATALTADPERAQSSARVSSEEIDRRAQSITYGKGLLNWRGSAPRNQSYVESEIGRLGKFYAANGLDTESALDEAQARFKATHTAVNGNFIYTAGRNVPGNFGDMATYALEKYAEDFGEAEGGKEAMDLTIRPASADQGSSWIIVDVLTQLPVENSERANLTLRSLYDLDEQRKAALRQNVIEDQHRNQKDRDAGIDLLDRVIPAVRGGPFSGDTYDAIQKRDEEDRKASGAVQGATKEKSLSDKIIPPIRLETLLPPVRGGWFSGADYEELNEMKSDED